VEELQGMLPSTWNWVKSVQSSLSSGEILDQKMDVVKGRGFVDCILFARSQVALPEILSLDAQSINHVRSEARCCVIASALAIHACNMAKVGTSSAQGSSDEVNDARRTLSSVLRKRHTEQNDLECKVIEATAALTKGEPLLLCMTTNSLLKNNAALAERDLTNEEVEALRNHTVAVLHGKDPVLKLLDTRASSFFRFACKWKPGLEMKTGRSLLKTDDNPAGVHGLKSTKEGFCSAAEQEAARLGFAHFGSELAQAGNEARGVISLACSLYGEQILDRFFVAARDAADR